MKMVIIARDDLGMSPGKLAAQVAHAAVGAYRECEPEIRNKWFNEGYTKVVVAVSSEKELNKYFLRARKAGLPSHLVEDWGFTELEPHTVTCVGIGPAPIEEIDTITKRLRLY